jgi:N6-adenosine-specific RNA methylase IME4
MVALVKYEAACQALAAAKTVDEAKGLRDKAEAMRAYARQAKNKGLEVDAAEIRMRAERRLGELIKAQKATVGLASGGQRGGRKKKDGSREEPANAPPTLAEAGIDKKLSSRAQKLAAVSEAQFESMVDDWRGRVGKEAERVTVNLLREGEIARRDADLARREVSWPDGKYPVIYADPPWRYEGAAPGSRAIENHYPTMTLEDICALPVPNIVPDDAVLFMWATSPMLAVSFDVLSAWGFTYRTCMVWVKNMWGMGSYARQQHEILLIAKRGALPTPEPSNRPSSVVEAPRLEHSAKPEVFYELIEQMYPGVPKVELFARQQRDGWAVFGNQAVAP